MDRSSDIILTIEWACNLKCPHCWHDGFRADLTPLSFEDYKKILLDNLQTNKYRRIILSGGEVTLKRNLTEYVQFAKDLRNIEHIRIQTNGMKLSNLDFCKSLLAAGVDEYYVSLYGHTAELHNQHTLGENSFDQTWAGLKNLSTLKATIAVGIVMTELNYPHLPEIFKMASSVNPCEVYVWNYVCMDETKKANLIASNLKIRPYLLKALEGITETPAQVFIMFYPECLLDRFKDFWEETKTDHTIDPLFYEKLDAAEIYTCPFKEFCPSEKCYGISLPQQKKYGLRGYSPFALKYLTQDLTTHPEKQQIKKYLSHKALFNLQDPFLPLFENLLLRSRNITVVPALKIAGDQFFPSQYHLLYNGSNCAPNIESIFQFVKLANICPEIQINSRHLKSIFDRGLKTADIKRVSTAIDLREDLNASRLKIHFRVDNLSKVSKPVATMHNGRAGTLPEPSEYMIGIDLFFNNTARLRLYYAYSEGQLKDAAFRSRLKKYFHNKVTELLALSNSLMVGFKENALAASFTFGMKDTNAFLERIKNPALAVVREKLQRENGGTKEIGHITLLEPELVQGKIEHLNVYC